MKIKICNMIISSLGFTAWILTNSDLIFKVFVGVSILMLLINDVASEKNNE